MLRRKAGAAIGGVTLGEPSDSVGQAARQGRVTLRDSIDTTFSGTQVTHSAGQEIIRLGRKKKYGGPGGDTQDGTIEVSRVQ